MGCSNTKETPQQIAYQRDFLGTCWNSPRADEADRYVPSHWLGVSKRVMQFNTMLHCLIVRGYHVDDELPHAAAAASTEPLQPQPMMQNGSILHASLVAGQPGELPASSVGLWRGPGNVPNSSFGFTDLKPHVEATQPCFPALQATHTVMHGNDSQASRLSSATCHSSRVSRAAQPTVGEASSTLLYPNSELGAAAAVRPCAVPPPDTLSAATAAVTAAAAAVTVHTDPMVRSSVSHVLGQSSGSIRYSSAGATMLHEGQVSAAGGLSGSFSSIRNTGLTTVAMMRRGRGNRDYDNNGQLQEKRSTAYNAAAEAMGSGGMAATPGAAPLVLPAPTLLSSPTRRHSFVGDVSTAAARDAWMRGAQQQQEQQQHRHPAHLADRVAVMGRITHSAHPYLRRYGLSVQQGVIFRVAPARRRYDQISLLLDGGAHLSFSSSSYSSLLLPPSILEVHQGVGEAEAVSRLWGGGGPPASPSSLSTRRCSCSPVPTHCVHTSDTNNGASRCVASGNSNNTNDAVVQAACAAMMSSTTNATQCKCGCADAAVHLASVPAGAAAAADADAAAASSSCPRPPVAPCNGRGRTWRSFYRVEDAAKSYSLPCRTHPARNNTTRASQQGQNATRTSHARRPTCVYDEHSLYTSSADDGAEGGPSTPPVVIGMITAHELLHLPLDAEVCLGGWLYLSLEDEQRRLRQVLDYYVLPQQTTPSSSAYCCFSSPTRRSRRPRDKRTTSSASFRADGAGGVWFPTGYVVIALPMYECSILPSAMYVQTRSRKSVSLNLANDQSRRMFGVGCVTRVRYGGVVVVECRDYVTYGDLSWLMTLASLSRAMCESRRADKEKANINENEEMVCMTPPPPHAARRLLRGLAQDLRSGGLYVIVARTHAPRRRGGNRVPPGCVRRLSSPTHPDGDGGDVAEEEEEEEDAVLSNTGYLTSEEEDDDDADSELSLHNNSSSSSSRNRRLCEDRRDGGEEDASSSSEVVMRDEPATELHSLMRGVFRQIGGIKCMNGAQLRQGCRVHYVTQSVLFWLRGLLQLPIKARPLCFFLQRFEGLAGILRQRAMEEEWQVLSSLGGAAAALTNASGDYSASFRAESLSFDVMPNLYNQIKRYDNYEGQQHALYAEGPSTLSHSFAASPRGRGHAGAALALTNYANDEYDRTGAGAAAAAGGGVDTHPSQDDDVNNNNNNYYHNMSSSSPHSPSGGGALRVRASVVAAPHRVKILHFNTFYTGPLEPVVAPVLSPELRQMIERYCHHHQPVSRDKNVCSEVDAAGAACTEEEAKSVCVDTVAATAAVAHTTTTTTTTTESSRKLPASREQQHQPQQQRQRLRRHRDSGRVKNDMSRRSASPRVIQRGRHTVLLQVRSKSLANNDSAAPAAAASRSAANHAAAMNYRSTALNTAVKNTKKSSNSIGVSSSNNKDSSSRGAFRSAQELPVDASGVPSQKTTTTLFTLHTVTAQPSSELPKQHGQEKERTDNAADHNDDTAVKEDYVHPVNASGGSHVDDGNSPNHSYHEEKRMDEHYQDTVHATDHTYESVSDHETAPSGLNATSACAVVAEHLRGHTVDSSSSDDDVASVVQRQGHGKGHTRRKKNTNPNNNNNNNNSSSDAARKQRLSGDEEQVQQNRFAHGRRRTVHGAQATDTLLPSSPSSSHLSYDEKSSDTEDEKEAQKEKVKEKITESVAVTAARQARDDARATLEEVQFLLANARAQWAALEREHVRLVHYFLPHTPHPCAALTPLYLKTLRQFPDEVPVCELREDWLPLLMSLLSVPSSYLFGYPTLSAVCTTAATASSGDGDGDGFGCAVSGANHDATACNQLDENNNNSGHIRFDAHTHESRTVFSGNACACVDPNNNNNNKDVDGLRQSAEQTWLQFRYSHLVSTQAAGDEAYCRDLFDSGVVSYTVQRSCAWLPPAQIMHTLTIATPPCCRLVGPQCKSWLPRPSVSASADGAWMMRSGGGGGGGDYITDGGGGGSNLSFADDPLQPPGRRWLGGTAAAAAASSGSRFTGGSLGVLAGVFHCYAGLLEARHAAMSLSCPSSSNHEGEGGDMSVMRATIIPPAPWTSRSAMTTAAAVHTTSQTAQLAREHNVFLRRLFLYGVTGAVRSRRSWAGWAVRRRPRLVPSAAASAGVGGKERYDDDASRDCDGLRQRRALSYREGEEDHSHSHQNSNSRGMHDSGNNNGVSEVSRYSAHLVGSASGRSEDRHAAPCCNSLLSFVTQLVAHRPLAHITSPAHVVECDKDEAAVDVVPFSRREMYALFDALACYVKSCAMWQRHVCSGSRECCCSCSSGCAGANVVVVPAPNNGPDDEECGWGVSPFELCIVAHAHAKMRAVDTATVSASPHWVTHHNRRRRKVRGRGSSSSRGHGERCRKTQPQSRRENAGRVARMMQRVLAKLRRSCCCCCCSSSSSCCVDKKSRSSGSSHARRVGGSNERGCGGGAAVQGNHLRDAEAPLRRCEVEQAYCGGEEMQMECTAKSGRRLFRAMQRALEKWKARGSSKDEWAPYRASISLTML